MVLLEEKKAHLEPGEVREKDDRRGNINQSNKINLESDVFRGKEGESG